MNQTLCNLYDTKYAEQVALQTSAATEIANVQTELDTLLTTNETILLTKIDTEGAQNVLDAEEFYNNRSAITETELSDKFEEAKTKIAEESEKVRSDALARALLYADDIQEEICIEMQNRVNGKIKKVGSVLTIRY